MKKSHRSSEFRIEDDPRRRLGLHLSSEDEDPATTRRKVIKDRLAIIGAILLFAILVFFMFADAVENYQCTPWQFVTFECNRFDAKFKPWDRVAPQPEK